MKNKLTDTTLFISEENDRFLHFMRDFPSICTEFKILGELKNSTIHLPKRKTSKLEKRHYSAYGRKGKGLSILKWPTITAGDLIKALDKQSSLQLCQECYKNVEISNHIMGFNSSALEQEILQLANDNTSAIINTYRISRSIEDNLIVPLEELTAEKIVSLWKNYTEQALTIEFIETKLDFEKINKSLKISKLSEQEKQKLNRIQKNCQMFLEKIYNFLTDEKTQEKVPTLFPERPSLEVTTDKDLKKIIFGLMPDYTTFNKFALFHKLNVINSKEIQDAATISALLNILQLGSFSGTKEAPMNFACCLTASKASTALRALKSYYTAGGKLKLNIVNTPTGGSVKQETLNLALLFWENSTDQSTEDFLAALAAAEKL